MTALDKKVKNEYKISSWIVGNRMAFAIIVKMFVPFAIVVSSVAIDAYNLYGMGSIGPPMFLLSLIGFFFNASHQLRRGELYEKRRDRRAEMLTHRRMRELGLKGRPWPTYFWEVGPRAHPSYPSADDIAVRIRKLTRVESFGSPIQGYLLSEVEGKLVNVVEDKEGDQLPELHSVRVGTQYISSCDPDDPDLDGVMNCKDRETLARAQTWVNQLNADSEAEYRLERKQSKAAPSP